MRFCSLLWRMKEKGWLKGKRRLCFKNTGDVWIKPGMLREWGLDCIFLRKRLKSWAGKFGRKEKIRVPGFVLKCHITRRRRKNRRKTDHAGDNSQKTQSGCFFSGGSYSWHSGNNRLGVSLKRGAILL